MSCDWKKRFKSPNQNNVDNPLRRVPPRYKYLPSGANKATPEKQAKMMLDMRKALGIMAGLIRMAISRRGPVPSPEKNANPSKSPNLVDLFLPLSGVA
jgi:hypothetical protein